SVAVANAQPEVKRIATWQTTQIGGYGAVREVCNLILNTHHTLDAALASYLNT
ncbi:MAG TPA: 3-deoxy-D-manno-octulosonate 8-phosphate phosphatase, partial [Legionellales bacterium]|nr:3-deoxy-D-manno-octulosonate 8-phosphate phosphatase [Legionellales bacterium]